MAFGRCHLDIGRRQRGGGVQLSVIIRADRTETIRIIRDLAAAINMRATLTPIAGSEDGGDGEGE